MVKEDGGIEDFGSFCVYGHQVIHTLPYLLPLKLNRPLLQSDQESAEGMAAAVVKLVNYQFLSSCLTRPSRLTLPA